MAQVSNFSGDQNPVAPKGTNPSDQPEEGKTSSLLSKVKDTAKGTFRKLKTKVKKGSGSDESSEDTSESQSSSEAQKESKEIAQSPGAIDDVEEEQNGSERKGSFQGEYEDDTLSPFARSGEDENAPLIASPTTYKEQHSNAADVMPPSVTEPTSVSDQNNVEVQQNNVEDVMPPSVIEPTSVSELGEESSTSLGNIPEVKDEEQQAVEESQEGGPDADINKRCKDTFRQKDLKAIDGLPKPRGFDDDNESSVKSNELRRGGSQDLGDETPSQEVEGYADGTYQGGEREFSGDGSTVGMEKGNARPHPPGSVAKFSDSMFRSSAIHDLKPNEPNAAEAKHANEVGTFSRGFDPKENQSSGKEGNQQHPPGSVAEFNDSMFRSSASHALKPNEPSAAEAKHAHEVGTFSRDFDPQANKPSAAGGDPENLQHPPATESELHEGMFSSAITSNLKPSQTDEPNSTNTNSEAGAPVGDLSREGESEGITNVPDAPQDLPPPGLAGDHMADYRKSEGSSARMDKGSYDHDNMPKTAEQEAESYFDAISNEEILASQRSLDSDDSKDFNPNATSEYNKQRDSLTESAGIRIETAKKEEVAAKETGSDGNAPEGTSTLTSALTSVVPNVGSIFGLGSSPARSSSSEGNKDKGYSTTSTSETVSTWISTTIGALLPGKQENEKTENDPDR